MLITYIKRKPVLTKPVSGDELATPVAIDTDALLPQIRYAPSVYGLLSLVEDNQQLPSANFYLDEYVYAPVKPWVEMYGAVYRYIDENRVVPGAVVADGLYIIELNIVPSADGVVTLRVRPINTATTVTVRQGSLGFMQEV